MFAFGFTHSMLSNFYQTVHSLKSQNIVLSQRHTHGAHCRTLLLPAGAHDDRTHGNSYEIRVRAISPISWNTTSILLLLPLVLLLRLACGSRKLGIEYQ